MLVIWVVDVGFFLLLLVGLWFGKGVLFVVVNLYFVGKGFGGLSWKMFVESMEVDWSVLVDCFINWMFVVVESYFGKVF